MIEIVATVPVDLLRRLLNVNTTLPGQVRVHLDGYITPSTQSELEMVSITITDVTFRAVDSNYSLLFQRSHIVGMEFIWS